MNFHFLNRNGDLGRRVVVASSGALIGLLLLLLLGGELSFWNFTNALQLASRSTIILLLLFTSGVTLFFTRPTSKELPELLAATLLLLFFSGWLTRPFGLLQGPSIRGEILLFALLATLTWKWQRWLLPTALLICHGLLFLWFFQSADGRMLFSDDNPTFFYRLLLLKEHFPNIPFYNPLWNGGIDARDFFATGVLNTFLLFSPLIYTFEVHSIYNLLVALLLFGVVPLSTFAASRIFGLSSRGGLLASILATSSSLLWYRWALQFGTMGFVTSTALLPLTLALGYRYFEHERISALQALATITVVSLYLLWSPAGIACIPLIFLGVIFIRKLLRQRWWIPSVLLLICIHLPWISLFWSVSTVGNFLVSEEERSSYVAAYSEETRPEVEEKEVELQKPKAYKHKKEAISLKNALKHLQEALHSAQPLVWVFAISGILLLSGMARLILASTLIWLLAVGSFGPMIKPQLEFDRFLVMALLVGSIPAGKALSLLFNTEHPRLLASLAIGFLFAGVWSVGGLLKNRSVVPIHYQPEEVQEVVQLTKEHAKGGRVLFSGFVLHDFGGGHIAPLPVLSQQPIIASNPVHKLWKYQQVFPKEFMQKGDSGIDEYLDLMNVSLVFAHERKWREYFRKREDLFTEIGRAGKFVAFERKYFPRSYFFKGSGEIINQSTNEVKFQLSSPSAVLRFQYFPFLEVDGCETIRPVPISASITFTAVSSCKADEPLSLHSVSPYKRWKLAYISKGGP